MSTGIEIELDRPRRVSFTFSDYKALQQRLGKPVGQIFQDLTNIDVVTLQTILHVGLRHEDKTLRFERVEELIDDYITTGHSVGDLLYTVNQAVVESGFFGQEKDGKGR